MGYFVGTWNCKGGPTSRKPRAAAVAFEFELGNAFIDQQVDVPAAGKMPAFRAATYSAYDAKKKHVISSGVDMAGDWYVSGTAGWKGNKLTWVDIAAFDNKLGKDVITKVDSNTYGDAGYDSASKLVFKAHCVRAPLAEK